MPKCNFISISCWVSQSNSSYNIQSFKFPTAKHRLSYMDDAIIDENSCFFLSSLLMSLNLLSAQVSTPAMLLTRRERETAMLSLLSSNVSFCRWKHDQTKKVLRKRSWIPDDEGWRWNVWAIQVLLNWIFFNAFAAAHLTWISKLSLFPTSNK